MITDPTGIDLVGAGAKTIELQCGPLKPANVRISYLPEEDKKQGTQGSVRVIEFQ